MQKPAPMSILHYAVVEHNWKAENKGDISLTVGDMIELIDTSEKIGQGWWRGRTLGTGEEGLFPMGFVRQLLPRTPGGGSPMRHKHQSVMTSSSSYVATGGYRHSAVGLLHKTSGAVVLTRPASSHDRHRGGGGDSKKAGAGDEGRLTISPSDPMFNLMGGETEVVDDDEDVIYSNLPKLDIRTVSETHVKAPKGFWSHDTWEQAVEKMKSKQNIAHLSAMEKHYQETIFEIVKSEGQYIDDLELVRKLFIEPIKAQQIISPKLVAIIFANVEQILSLHQAMYTTLRQQMSSTGTSASIAGTVLEYSDYLRIYTIYCGSLNMGQQAMKRELMKNRKFRQYVDDTLLLPQCKSRSLDQLLSRPVQHVCRYVMMIRQLKAASSAADLAGPKGMDAAEVKLVSILQIVMEANRTATNRAKMALLQSKIQGLQVDNMIRRFIDEKAFHLTKINQVGLQDPEHKVILFLCSDMLVIGKAKHKFRQEKHKVESHMCLGEFRIDPTQPIQVEEPHEAAFCLVDTNARYICRGTHAHCGDFVESLIANGVVVVDAIGQRPIISTRTGFIPREDGNDDKKREHKKKGSAMTLKSSSMKRIIKDVIGNIAKKRESIENLEDCVGDMIYEELPRDIRRSNKTSPGNGLPTFLPASITQAPQKLKTPNIVKDANTKNFTEIPQCRVAKVDRSRKGFTYRIEVDPTDGKEFGDIINRTYKEFYRLHVALIGLFQSSTRTLSFIETDFLPNFPHPVMVVTEEIAQQRVPLLCDYIAHISVLPQETEDSSPLLGLMAQFLSHKVKQFTEESVEPFTSAAEGVPDDMEQPAKQPGSSNKNADFLRKKQKTQDLGLGMFDEGGEPVTPTCKSSWKTQTKMLARCQADSVTAPPAPQGAVDDPLYANTSTSTTSASESQDTSNTSSASTSASTPQPLALAKLDVVKTPVVKPKPKSPRDVTKRDEQGTSSKSGSFITDSAVSPSATRGDPGAQLLKIASRNAGTRPLAKSPRSAHAGSGAAGGGRGLPPAVDSNHAEPMGVPVQQSASSPGAPHDNASTRCVSEIFDLRLSPSHSLGGLKMAAKSKSFSSLLEPETEKASFDVVVNTSTHGSLNFSVPMDSIMEAVTQAVQAHVGGSPNLQLQSGPLIFQAYNL